MIKLSCSVVIFRLVAFCLFVGISMNSQARAPFVVDQVETLLQQAKKNTSQNFEQAINLAKQAIQIASQNNLRELKAEGHLLICSMYNSGENYDSLYQHCQEAIQYFENQGNTEQAAWGYQRSGIIEDLSGDRQKAQSTFEKSLALFESIGNKHGMAFCLNDLGVLHSFKGDYVSASKYYFDALVLFELFDDQLGIARVYTCLGYFYKRQLQPKKAEEYFKQAFDKAKKEGDRYWTGMSLMGLIKMLRKKEDFKEAFQLNQQLIEIGTQLKSNYLLFDATKNQAFLYFDLGLLKESKESTYQSLELLKKQKRKQSQYILFNLLAEIYIKENQLEKAFEYILKVKENKAPKKSKAKAYSLLTQYWEKQQQFDKAFEAQKIYIELQNKLKEKEKTITISRVESSYQLGQKQSTINNLNKENEIQQSALYKRNILLVVVVFLSTLLFSVLYRNYYLKQKMNQTLEQKINTRTKDLLRLNKKLERSNQELKNFAHLTSHDLKEPLRNIFGFFHLLEKRDLDLNKATAIEYIQLAKKNAVQMNSLINDIMAFTQVEDESILLEKIALEDVAKKAIQTVDNLIQQKGGIVHLGKLPIVNTNPKEIAKVFEQLITNGIKFNQSNQPTIFIEGVEMEEEYLITVMDNGIGIEEEYLEKIFGMFSRLHNRQSYEGSGAGLAIAKKIIEKQGGRIYVKSQVDEGSSFVFTIPKEEKKSQNTDLSQYLNKSTQVTSTI